MKPISVFGLLGLAQLAVGALVGMGSEPYSPPCAMACRRSIESNMLSCSSHQHSGGHKHGGPAPTSPQCRAGNTAFLTTLAGCMNTNCARDRVATSELEKFWEDRCTGDLNVSPKWDYSTALHQVGQPSRRLNEDDTLDFTAVVPEATWDLNYRTLVTFSNEERVHARYAVVILVVGFATPIFLTWLGYLPYMTGILERTKPYFVYPALIGTYHKRPLPYSLGKAPTVGQSLYVALMVILNILLTAVNYKATEPFLWYKTQHQEVLSFVMYRTGTIGFALAPLLILFSSRNNILLWLSNWSHSTYMLLHRWVARIFGIQVLLHSFTALALYIEAGTFASEEKLPYWIWGSVATVATSIMLVASGLYVRRWSYEIFLITHIVFAVIVIVGCWYHVHPRFAREWGYETWMYAAFAVWAFDRIARFMRVLKIGLRRAKVVDVGEGFVRVDIEGIRWSATPGQHVYAYFPTVNKLRPWENHPFSVLPTALLQTVNHSISAKSSDTGAESDKDLEKHNGTSIQTRSVANSSTTAGLTLFIRKSTGGMTNHLKAHDSLLTLLDGPYPNNAAKPILACDRVLLIGGGIGITGLLPWVTNHTNVKLCWSVKETAESLVHAMDAVLGGLNEKDVRVGRRLDINASLSREVQSGWAKIGVVACGPGGLCDDVSAAVVAAGKQGRAIFELQVDAYSW